ncbi:MULTISPECIES: hypothetical protein [Aneurinibacillus]|uniref:Uncharacterized protein n=1 Tax=Aneurinibacillus thermoaerophilus TaxID=143495 RepID=A0A1G8BGE7_ANETH|nr:MULTISPECIES: hypothetical protein [Aneurinibacillus]MED0674256.1 hypothetical protein [Aneurinibacillus thermoaerophilus]MED0678648.1 hypothetical protein [Aneurinibacillus thermoaerophilus]MED0737806.1 hypothetical protein [Aneurinibacillus thermoaerophilus]MED0755838.1 hypothetical protein [Aneurinibacillus thermoaerophilus]MED0759514.1 hypothetical protein [Aneurinibacillus thermoaerophilus]
MNLEKIKKFLEENKENADVQAFLKGLVTADARLLSSIKVQFLSL